MNIPGKQNNACTPYHTNLILKECRVVADRLLVATGANGIRQHCLVDAPVSVPSEIVGVVVDLFPVPKQQKAVRTSSIKLSHPTLRAKYSKSFLERQFRQASFEKKSSMSSSTSHPNHGSEDVHSFTQPDHHVLRASPTPNTLVDLSH